MSQKTKRAFEKAQKMINSGEYVELVKRFFSGKFSAKYGHSVFSHFRMTDDDLIHRCLSERVSGASTFDISEDDFADIVCNYLQDEDVGSELLTWLYLAIDGELSPRYALVIECPKAIGHGFLKGRERHNWKEGAKYTTQILVIFQVDKENPYDPFFKIITAFPFLEGMGFEY